MKLHLTKKDFRLEWYSGTGGGGQHRNKHQNCCRITHIESGLQATGQSHRDRPTNQKEAFNRLVQKLLVYYSDDEQTRNAARNVVRTYHMERNSVDDGVIKSTPEKVLNGDITEFVENALLGNRPTRETGRM